MARRRRSTATTDEGRFIASRIQDARRRGATNQEIADAFGIHERTVRKIVSGETPATRTFKRKMAPPSRPISTPNVFRADIELAPGEVRTVNVKVPDLPTRQGRQAPTPFDVFRVPSLESVVAREERSMAIRYGFVGAGGRGLIGLRSVARRNPATRLIEIRGTVRG